MGQLGSPGSSFSLTRLRDTGRAALVRAAWAEAPDRPDPAAFTAATAAAGTAAAAAAKPRKARREWGRDVTLKDYISRLVPHHPSW